MEEQFSELSFYTLSLGDPEFIHQNIVDAYTAQHADINIKPIALAFSLIGLYLLIEKKFTGREVQLFHVKMSKNKIKWPRIPLPLHRGDITITHVLNKEAGIDRDKMIKTWCTSVWDSYKESHKVINDLYEYYK
jgi:hypothetical protein